MIAECKRNPRVLAGEILDKTGAIDLTPLDEESGSTANQVLTIARPSPFVSTSSTASVPPCS